MARKNTALSVRLNSFFHWKGFEYCMDKHEGQSPQLSKITAPKLSQADKWGVQLCSVQRRNVTELCSPEAGGDLSFTRTPWKLRHCSLSQVLYVPLKHQLVFFEKIRSSDILH